MLDYLKLCAVQVLGQKGEWRSLSSDKKSGVYESGQVTHEQQFYCVARLNVADEQNG